MSGRRLRIVMAAALLVAAGISGASAQQPQTVRIRGTIEKVDGNTVVVKAADGAETTLTLTANAVIVGVVKASLAEIKPGAQFFIVAGTKQADGTIAAPAINVGRDGAVPPM